jgi:hypothetical protein
MARLHSEAPLVRAKVVMIYLHRMTNFSVLGEETPLKALIIVLLWHHEAVPIKRGT